MCVLVAANISYKLQDRSVFVKLGVAACQYSISHLQDTWHS